jgi:pyruvate formate lyase activating enzyme
MRKAKYYQKLDGRVVRCSLCPHQCVLSEEKIGVCRTRKNIKGELYSLVYGKVVSTNLDPIEKKPFYHFLPGTTTYSIATTGCNLQCRFCQNWQISQASPDEVQSVEMTPEEVVENALNGGAKSIAYTYVEPTVFYEFMFDTAKLARQKGLKNVVVSSGYINPDPLKDLLPYIDAYNVDFKGMNDNFYRKMTNGSLEPVLEAMKIIKKEGVWLEVVNLLIPGENDSEKNIRNLAVWIRDNLGEEVPLHFSRFYPAYKLANKPPTPIETVKKAREIALNLGLKYVYTGNIYHPEGSTTYCPNSDKKAIVREGIFIKVNNLDENGRCNGQTIPGVWK